MDLIRLTQGFRNNMPSQFGNQCSINFLGCPKTQTSNRYFSTNIAQSLGVEMSTIIHFKAPKEITRETVKFVADENWKAETLYGMNKHRL